MMRFTFRFSCLRSHCCVYIVLLDPASQTATEICLMMYGSYLLNEVDLYSVGCSMSSRCTGKPQIREDCDGARISLSRKSVRRSIRYTLVRSTANSILVNIAFIEQPYKIPDHRSSSKAPPFSSRKTLEVPFSANIFAILRNRAYVFT